MSQYTLRSGRPEPSFARIVYTPDAVWPKYKYSAQVSGVVAVGDEVGEVGAVVGEVVGDVGATVGVVVGDVGAEVGARVGPAIEL